MPKAVIFSNCTVSSWALMADYFTLNFREQGIEVIHRALPVTAEERAAVAAEFPSDTIFFHNCVPTPGKPLKDPACVPDVKWYHLGYRSDVIAGFKNILLPAYEFSALPEPWVALYNRYDEIWVTTRHVGDLLEKSGVTTKIVKLPPALDRQTYPIKKEYKANEPFKFLFVGEPHFRKGVHFLMYGFLKAFPKVGQAELTIKTSDNKDWVSLREDIKIVTGRIHKRELFKMFTAADCYITASLAEGLGLPLTEAALIGLPVCANNWGGQRDVVTPGGYFPLAHTVEHRPWVGAPQFYTPGQMAAISDEDAVARAMLKIVKSTPAARAAMAKKARQKVVAEYGYKALKPQWGKEIARLWAF